MNSPKVFVNVMVYIIDDGTGYLSAYCPALNLAGQGADEQSAMNSFNEVLSIFLEETQRKGTLHKVLRDLGWRNHNEPPLTSIPSYLFAAREVAVPVPA